MFEYLDDKDKKAYSLIRNKLIHSGKKPTLQEINEVTGGRSPRSASLVIDRLVKIGLLKKHGGNIRLTGKQLNSSSVTTVDVPLVGHVACGMPFLANENIEAMIPVSTAVAKPGAKYFFLKARGDSMDEAGIYDGDLILIKQQNTAENGQYVVAVIDDEATVKEFQHKGNVVALLPKSKNKKHKPIILDREFRIQGLVVTTIPDINI